MNQLQSIKQRFGIIGRSENLNRALETAIRVSPTDLTVLIQGESGVGKESFSKIIHNLSHRKHEPFIAINCGAIPEGTINSELFGHTKGSFTGATGERKGYFETVDGGTIFLDEIGEMPLDTQSYLLRVLENGEFFKVGSSDVLTTDVRVIAATNVNLLERVKNGKFREDLYYRLNTVPIYVPPLRERKEDIYILFRKFTLDFAEDLNIEVIQLDDQAKILLENYTWPGNIRELKNIAQQLTVLAERRHLDAEDLLMLLPKIRERNLPSKTMLNDRDQYQEREILYKLLFDMKSDLKDLKSLVFGLIEDNNLDVPSQPSNNLTLQSGELNQATFSKSQWDENFDKIVHLQENQQFVIEHKNSTSKSNDGYNHAEILEESLSLEDMEKRLIKRALKKHKGKRKTAAEELGISERTLYRKISQYDIDI